MPCDQIITSRVKLQSNVAPDLLARAMMALGVAANEYTHDAARGIVTLRRANGSAVISQANIAQAYSAEIVKATAAKRGWKLTQTAPFKFAVTKGGI